MKINIRKQANVYIVSKLVTIIISIFFITTSCTPMFGLSDKSNKNNIIGNKDLNNKSNNNFFNDKLLPANYQKIYRDYNDVSFNSSFEMGNLYNVTYQAGGASGYRYYTANVNYSTATFADKHWWFYYSIENTTGKTITVKLINLSSEDFFDTSGDLPRWPNIEPMYSYDNKNWFRVPLNNVTCNTTELTFTITIKPTQDKIWLAPIPPYTVTMRDNLFASFASSPYFNVSSLGITPLGQNLTMATITDPTIDDDEKFKVYVIAQQHSGETPSSFVADGMIRFLLNKTDATAAVIRENLSFRFVPIVNVEGVYYGISRYTPFRGGVQYDMNRAWDDDLIFMLNTCPEVRWVFDDIQAWEPDAFIDLHSEVNGESYSQDSEDCFFLHSGLYNDTMIRFLDNISLGSTGDKDYWPETGARSATGSAMAAVNVRTRLGVHPSICMEHPHDNRTGTLQHPVDHNPQTVDDWMNWGKGIILGINDYFKYEPKEEYQVQLKQRWNIVSIPINKTVYQTDITLENNSIDYSWAEAVAEGIILDIIYGYSRTTQSYMISNSFTSGYGYWLWVYYNCTIKIKMGPTDSNTITTIQIRWNIVGLPFNSTLQKENLIINYNGSDYSWAEAIQGSDPIVLDFVYKWNEMTQQYFVTDILQPGKGYWMYAYYVCTIRK